VNKAVKAFLDSDHFPSEPYGGLDSGTDYGIERRTVAATSEYSNSHRRRHFFLKRGVFKDI
jgi:hypothetical protein